MAKPQNNLAQGSEQPATNRKPADELADIREQIRELKAREETVRTKILSGACSKIGDDYQAVVSEVTQTVIDDAKIKKELGLEFLRPFLKERTIVKVTLKPIGGGTHHEP